MKIAIDLRSLSSGSISGVENYTLRLLDVLLSQDKENKYTLFYNSWGKTTGDDMHFVNSQTKRTRIPNKILNAALKMQLVTMEKMIGDFDCLFMPNLNQFTISPSAKLAITVHDLSPVVSPEFYNMKRRLWHKFLNYKRAFERANIIFAVSEYTKTDLMRLFNVPGEKIRVVYPGVDHSVFHPNLETDYLREIRNRYSLPGNFLLFLNTIEPRKNLINLIKAFDNLPDRTNLIIAGKVGWKYQTIFEALKKSPKLRSIKYLGYLPEADKPGIIKLSQALIYPSFYEGFGFQPLEAMAIGVPVMVSNVTALPEVSGDAALLVNPYSIAEITEGLHAIINNEDLRQRLIAKGLERSNQFTWQRTAEQVLAGLKDLKD